MVCTACLVCFISNVNGHWKKKKKRKEEAHPWKAGASSGHTTNLKQSVLRLSISMAQSENGLAHKFKTILKKPERGKHSSLSCFCVSDEYKKLYLIDVGSLGNCEN